MASRFIAVLAALCVAPAAVLADDAAPAAPATVDPSVLEGKLEALTEQYAETRTEVASLKKLKLSGYLQARWAWREDANYNLDAVNAKADKITQTGFHIRRGRVKAVYTADVAAFTLQLDAIPTGVSVKEGYASVNLPMGMAVDAGLQLFPFGYEVASRSSADLDTLERSEATRKLLAGEYDLGVALRGKALKNVSWKLGLFNGNGVEGASVSGGTDNDQLKDVIGRVTGDFGVVTAGLSGWYGTVRATSQVFGDPADPKKVTGTKQVDYDRQRVGADVQAFLDLLPIGGTALKAEWIWGKSLLKNDAKVFGAGEKLGKTVSGWYVTATQNLGPMNQLALRYEQFNTDHGLDVSAAGSNKVKVDTELQAALHTFLGESAKLTLAWFHPMYGEKGDKAADGPKTDRFIAQLQAKF